MDKQIPIYFDNVTITAPAQLISAQNQRLARLKVAAFTKYGNRNGSYITEEVANSLIDSATTGTTPVVGFFDPATEKWAGHTGPKLANGYGYVESFLGWEPMKDTDGVIRDYAVFSVVLFTDYFEEATKILGQNQSMELDPEFIDGNWAVIDDIEYFVYSKAKMLGFCIIGDHEPCFSVSTFFSKDDSTYKSQFEKFASLLSDLKAQVEDAEKGGKQPMNEFEEVQTVEETVESTEETAVVEETPAAESAVEFEVTEESAEAEVVEEAAEEVTEETEFEAEPATEPSELDTLRAQFEELQNTYNTLQESNTELQANYEAAQTTINSLNEELNNLRAQLATYQAQAEENEKNRKQELLDSYQSLIEGEEIAQFQTNINDFSYDELESKLAVVFARKQMAANSETHKVPLPEQEESSFALLMKKYKKN